MGERLVVSQTPLDDAGKLLANELLNIDKELGWARLAIPGGSALDVLGVAKKVLPADVWARVRLTWVDERCMPRDDADSNRGTAYRKGYLTDQAPPARELPLWEDGDTPARAMARFNRRFDSDFSNGLDVTLLGLGEDGHVASLFPTHPVRHSTAAIAHLTDSPKPPPERITLTFKTLRTSRTNILYAVGEGKRAALERILSGDPLAPANILPGELVIVTDQALEKKP